jgi:CDP-glucose 4,6-dehydratase
MNSAFWSDKRVLLTGHTGFKGAWLALWLQSLGAEVTGIALEPQTEPNLFDLAAVGEGMHSVIADIRDRDVVSRVMQERRPEIVLHLAAQALVRTSYREPLETFSTNVMGTAKVLDAMRDIDTVRAAVIVTTDKCYENLESEVGYREEDRLGGHDPYAASKACAELVVTAYRRSYFSTGSAPAVASARAGNVIGGGDWAEDRLLTDIMQGIASGEPILIRNPFAVRPWQHVLDPLNGYLTLAEALYEKGAEVAEAWNFGPGEDDLMTVGQIADHLTATWGEGASWTVDDGEHPHETHLLRLDSGKATARLGWTPALPLSEALEWIVSWHRAHQRSENMRERTMEQIADFEPFTSRSPRT